MSRCCNYEQSLERFKGMYAAHSGQGCRTGTSRPARQPAAASHATAVPTPPAASAGANVLSLLSFPCSVHRGKFCSSSCTAPVAPLSLASTLGLSGPWLPILQGSRTTLPKWWSPAVSSLSKSKSQSCRLFQMGDLGNIYR